MEKKRDIIIKAPILEWLRTRPHYEVEAFKKWYLKYHGIPEDWVSANIPSERVHREINAILATSIEVLEKIKVEATDEQPLWDE